MDCKSAQETAVRGERHHADAIQLPVSWNSTMRGEKIIFVYRGGYVWRIWRISFVCNTLSTIKLFEASVTIQKRRRIPNTFHFISFFSAGSNFGCVLWAQPPQPHLCWKGSDVWSFPFFQYCHAGEGEQVAIGLLKITDSWNTLR